MRAGPCLQYLANTAWLVICYYEANVVLRPTTSGHYLICRFKTRAMSSEKTSIMTACWNSKTIINSIMD